MITAEKQIATSLEWEQCDWFAKPTVVKYRAVVDSIVFRSPEEAIIVDFKSGKFRDYADSPTSQLRLTATMSFSIFPNLEEVTCTYLYVEHKKSVSGKFSRDQLDELKKPFDEAYEKVNADQEFKYTKNQYCNWCLVKDCPVRAK